MNYKRIIPNQEARLKILKLTNFVPDKLMVKLQYRIKTGRKLNLEEPKRFTEKLQWYKLNYRTSLMTQCADKLRVRDYVDSKGFGNILIPLHGYYYNIEELDFSELPNSFILKTNNGSHTNIICKDKGSLNYKATLNKLENWLTSRTPKAGREWAYYDIKPCIVCEELLVDMNNPNEDIRDYKFLCFNGRVEYIWVDIDRSTNHKRNFYDRTWNFLNISSDYPNTGDVIPKPEKLAEMITIAEKLSEEFPHVRVDLYFVNESIFFGELTFYSLSGYESFNPDNFDYVLGDLFELPN